jgi:hypothetical protein
MKDIEPYKRGPTPWGQADWVTKIAKGMYSVSTPGHGGFWLAPELARRLKAVAEPLGWKPFTGDWQWLEEDCDAYLGPLLVPGAFAVSTGQKAYERVSTYDYFPKGLADALAPNVNGGVR